MNSARSYIAGKHWLVYDSHVQQLSNLQKMDKTCIHNMYACIFKACLMLGLFTAAALPYNYTQVLLYILISIKQC